MGPSKVNTGGTQRRNAERVLAYVSGDVGIEAGKDDGTVLEVVGLTLVYDHVPHDGRYRCCLFPVCGL